jgi:hypothetical protein
VTSSVIRARDAVLQAAGAQTQLPPDTQTVAVVLDGSGSDLPVLSIGGAATSPDEPQLVQLGERTAMLVSVAPTGKGPVTVDVADQRTLAGVVGSSLQLAVVADQLAASGAGAFGSLAATAPAAAGTLRWRSA